MKITTLQVGPICTNCYILQDETQKLCAVIDPGDEGGRIADAVQATGSKPLFILLTHGHGDHTGGIAALERRIPGLPVSISAAEPVGAVFPSEAMIPSDLFAPLPAGVEVRHYRDGDTLAVGSLTVQVLATPGHSEGGVSLLVGDALFCGDTLFAGSCGRTDLPGGSVPKILSSLGRLGRLEGNLRVYPGHMESSTLDRERGSNPYLMHALRTNQ